MTMYSTLAVISILGMSEASKIRIADDGGFEDIVVKIDNNVDRVDCSDILRGFEVRKMVLNCMVTQIIFSGPVYQILPAASLHHVWQDILPLSHSGDPLLLDTCSVWAACWLSYQ